MFYGRRGTVLGRSTHVLQAMDFPSAGYLSFDGLINLPAKSG